MDTFNHKEREGGGGGEGVEGVLRGGFVEGRGGAVGGGGGGWTDQLYPVAEETSIGSRDGDESSEYESDWETGITGSGEVFHVVPVSETELSTTQSKVNREKKKKKIGKLSRLVRKREKRENLASQVQNESSDGDSSTYGQIKTFESFFEGTNPVEQVDLQIRLNVKRGMQVNLLQEYLGIIPGDIETMNDSTPYSSSRLIIAGFKPGAPAIKLIDKLRLGDWIRSIDGLQVNKENIDSVLRRFTSSCKIKLTIQRTAPISQILGEDDQLLTPPSILNIVTGQGPSPGDIQSMLRKLPYIVLYLSRQSLSESSPEFADIIYQYPTHNVSKLVQIRGLFLTLAHALPEITGSRPVTSSLLVEDQLVHVGYAEEREDLFILALPATKCSAKEVSQVLRDTVRVLRLKYKTMNKAFSPKNHTELHELFSILFLDLLVNIQKLSCMGKPVLDITTVLSPHHARFDENLPAPQLLILPEEVKFQVDDTLSQLESGDFQEFSPDFHDAPREFNILGTCLFHQGLLVASHLCRDDMVDVFLWSKYNQILPLTKLHPVQQIVSWSEIYLTSRSWPGSTHNPDPESRTFLLTVGLGYQVLSVILETGGGAQSPVGVVRPDPFYVDQALSTLESLEETGIASVCNKWLTLPPNPEILDVDKLFESSSAHKKLNPGLSVRKEEQISGIVLKKTMSYEYASTDSPSGSLDGSISFNQSQSDGNSEYSLELREREEERISSNSSPGSDEESSLWQVYHSENRSHITIQEASDTGEEDVMHYRMNQLSVSPENTIIHYLHLDVGEGVYLSPINSPTGPWHTQILDNFKSACQIIHSGFQIALSSNDLMKTSSNSSPWFNKSLVGVREQSLLFQQRLGKGEDRIFEYWVAGRLFLAPHPRECYVCYHDSAPQIMVELAYRLAFGVHL